MNRGAERQAELKFKIANLELGIFTEPFLIHTWIVSKYFDGIQEDIKPAINLPGEWPVNLGFTGHRPLVTAH